MISKLPEKISLTDDELEAVNDLARGSFGHNLVTYAGRALSPTSGALGAASTAASVAHGLWSGGVGSLGLPAMGLAAMAISDRTTMRKARRLAALMRAGGTHEALMRPDNALQRLAKTKADALARALLAGELSLVPYAVSHE